MQRSVRGTRYAPWTGGYQSSFTLAGPQSEPESSMISPETKSKKQTLPFSLFSLRGMSQHTKRVASFDHRVTSAILNARHCSCGIPFRCFMTASRTFKASSTASRGS